MRPASRNGPDGWSLPSRLMHWLGAGLIFFMLGLGFYMANWVPDVYRQFALTQLHKSWGAVAFGLVILRFLWRLWSPPPPLPPGMSPRMEMLARFGHYMLYLLMFCMPLSGWLMASASPLQETYGVKNMIFGWVAMPDPFVPGSKSIADALAWVHFLCAILLSVLVLGHILAALWHQYILRDGLISQMIRGKSAAIGRD